MSRVTSCPQWVAAQTDVPNHAELIFVHSVVREIFYNSCNRYEKKERENVCVCVCACASESERERKIACVCVSVRERKNPHS